MPDAAQPDPFDDDISWLAADFVPASPPPTVPTVPPAPPVGPIPAVPNRPSSPASAASRPMPAMTAGVAAPATTNGPAPRTSAWLAVGAEFQPLPGGPLLTRTDTVPPAARAIAEPGATVHAVLAGVLHRSGLGMELRADDGRVVGYRGDAVVQWTAGDGERLPAGAIIGWLSEAGNQEAPSFLTFYLLGVDGVALDPVGWLAGLPDPRELAFSGGVAGGVDPFLLDLRLAGHLNGPGGTP